MQFFFICTKATCPSLWGPVANLLNARDSTCCIYGVFEGYMQQHTPETKPLHLMPQIYIPEIGIFPTEYPPIRDYVSLVAPYTCGALVEKSCTGYIPIIGIYIYIIYMYIYIYMGHFQNRICKIRQKCVKNTLFKIKIVWTQIENKKLKIENKIRSISTKTSNFSALVWESMKKVENFAKFRSPFPPFRL